MTPWRQRDQKEAQTDYPNRIGFLLDQCKMWGDVLARKPGFKELKDRQSGECCGDGAAVHLGFHDDAQGDDNSAKKEGLLP